MIGTDGRLRRALDRAEDASGAFHDRIHERHHVGDHDMARAAKFYRALGFELGPRLI